MFCRRRVAAEAVGVADLHLVRPQQPDHTAALLAYLLLGAGHRHSQPQPQRGRGGAHLRRPRSGELS